MVFKPYQSTFGVKRNGVSYEFPDVASMQIEDPETTKLTRGANGANKLGLVYKEGIRDPKVVTVTIMNMSPDLKAMLDAVYAGKERVDVFCIDNTDGSSKMGKNAILSQQPQQLTVDDSVDSMNVALRFETFDLGEVHKS